MKLLLTSGGLTNKSIRQGLIDLLDKPISQCKAIFIPTAIYAMPDADLYARQMLRQLATMGWQEITMLELTTLPGLPEEHWLPSLEAADVIWVSGGNTNFLSYWMQESGFAQKLPALLQKAAYVGISAGSMVVTHSLQVNPEKLKQTGIYYDEEYDEAAPLHAGSDKALKLVDFVIRPHLNFPEYFPNITLKNMEKSAARVDVPLYAIDDQTAIKVVDDTVQVISEGEWKLFKK